MQYKSRAKVQAEKTTLEDALKYAIYFLDRFHLVASHKGPLLFNATSPYSEEVQKYLVKRAEFNSQNNILGIMAVVDYWYQGRFSTGGRIHLYMGGEGNFFEALDSEVIITDPVDYEEKDLIIRKIFSGLSNSVPPNAGNIHLHPHLCNLEKVDIQTVRKELTMDHGTQNSIGPDAPLQYFLLKISSLGAAWDRRTTDKDVQKVFSKTA